MSINYLFNKNEVLPEVIAKDKLKELFIAIKKGSKEARDLIIVSNIRLVLHEVTKRYTFHDFYDKEELVAIGLIGLIKAVDSFDIDLDYEFSTYATICIQNELKMHYRKVLNESHYISNLCSLDSFVEDEIKLYSVIPDPDINIEDDSIENDLKLEIKRIIEHLPKRDKEIMSAFYGINGYKPTTQTELAYQYGYSQSHISRILRKNLKIIKYCLFKQGYLEKEQEYRSLL